MVKHASPINVLSLPPIAQQKNQYHSATSSTQQLPRNPTYQNSIPILSTMGRRNNGFPYNLPTSLSSTRLHTRAKQNGRVERKESRKKNKVSRRLSKSKMAVPSAKIFRNLSLLSQCSDEIRIEGSKRKDGHQKKPTGRPPLPFPLSCPNFHHSLRGGAGPFSWPRVPIGHSSPPLFFLFGASLHLRVWLFRLARPPAMNCARMVHVSAFFCYVAIF